ncbi:MAG: hypothetical protein ACE37F_01510, partial [Nannocystaceae bacterium]
GEGRVHRAARAPSGRLTFIHAVIRRPLVCNAEVYSELFWPELREFQGMVLLADLVEDHEDEARVAALLQQHGDRTEVEKAFNLVEVPLLFGKRAGEATEEEVDFLAERLREMWSARLKACFPQREFLVEVCPPDEDAEVSLRFFQARAEKPTA